MKRFFPLLAMLSIGVASAVPQTPEPAGYVKVITAEDCYAAEGLAYPLEDAALLSGQELADSASVVLKYFPGDTYALECRALGRIQAGDYQGGFSDALAAWKNHDFIKAEDLIGYVAAVRPEMVIDCFMPRIDALKSSHIERERYRALFMVRVIGDIYYSRNEMEKAYRMLERASGIRDYENLIDVPMLKSTILLMTGNHDRARKMIKPLYDEYGCDHFPDAVNNYYIALRDGGKTDKALKVLKKASEESVWHKHRYMIDYATLLAATGRYDEAFPIFDEVILGATPDVKNYFDTQVQDLLQEALLRKGIYKTLSGDSESGQEYIRRALSLNDGEEEPSGFEPVAYAWLGDREKAFNWLELLGVTDADPLAIGAVHAILGDSDKALEYVGKAFRLHLTSPEALRYDANYRSIIDSEGMKELVRAYKPLKL